MITINPNSSLLHSIRQTVQSLKRNNLLFNHDRSLRIPLEGQSNVLLVDAVRKVIEEAVENPFGIKPLGQIEEEKFALGDIVAIDVSGDTFMPQEQLIARKWLPCIYLGKHKLERHESEEEFYNFEAVYKTQESKKDLPVFAGYSIPVNRQSKIWNRIFRVIDETIPQTHKSMCA